MKSGLFRPDADNGHTFVSDAVEEPVPNLDDVEAFVYAAASLDARTPAKKTDMQLADRLQREFNALHTEPDSYVWAGKSAVKRAKPAKGQNELDSMVRNVGSYVKLQRAFGYVWRLIDGRRRDLGENAGSLALSQTKLARAEISLTSPRFSPMPRS